MKNSLILLVIAVIFSLAACQNKQSQLPNEPPMPKITAGGKQVNVVRGSSCWSANGQGKCVDMVSPKELLKDVEPTVAAAGTKLTIAFDYTPTELGSNVSTEKETKELTLEKDNTIALPSEKGRYIYEVHARWKEGSSSFVFLIEVK